MGFTSVLVTGAALRGAQLSFVREYCVFGMDVVVKKSFTYLDNGKPRLILSRIQYLASESLEKVQRTPSNVQKYCQYPVVFPVHSDLPIISRWGEIQPGLEAFDENW